MDKTKTVKITIKGEEKNLYLRFPTDKDLSDIIAIEQLCFAPAEAATPEALTERMKIFPENFIIAEIENESKERKMIGMVDGISYDEPVLIDEIYSNANLHNKNGKYCIIMGLNTHPDYRRLGVASHLMKYFIEISKERGQKGMILTCKEIYIPLYEKLGFKNCGVSDSSHAGVVWYDMKYFY
ncbi:MAG: GNAT family N-acetyltransferase [archaeon]|nr:GNAT family N-acetyltransferase [archaeon]